MEENYLNSVQKQFEYYKTLGEKTFAQLSEDELFWQFNSESNSIAITVNHLWGNMKSRWTDFLNSDGEKEWRKRDLEFESVIKTNTELLEKWEEGWDCLFTALSSLNTDNFNSPIYIRNQRHSIIEAINQQMMHYAYHIGQIVYVGRMVKGKDWQSLSIPKGKSEAFNAENKVAEPIRKDLPELIVRAKALFIDSLVVVGAMALITFLFEQFAYEGNQLRKYAYISIWLYDPVMVSLGGTLGHRLMKLRVRRFSNEAKKPLLPLAIIRFVFKLLLGWLSLITVSTNKSKRAIHDLATNTIVIKHKKFE